MWNHLEFHQPRDSWSASLQRCTILCFPIEMLFSTFLFSLEFLSDIISFGKVAINILSTSEESKRIRNVNGARKKNSWKKKNSLHVQSYEKCKKKKKREERRVKPEGRRNGVVLDLHLREGKNWIARLKESGKFCQLLHLRMEKPWSTKRLCSYGLMNLTIRDFLFRDFFSRIIL